MLASACSSEVSATPSSATVVASSAPLAPAKPEVSAIPLEADASAPPSPPAPSATASAEAPPPNVKVTNIGMHIGGGPNDAATKSPIKRSVEPHFDAFRRCFALVEDMSKGGDVGVDLHIPKAGGKAKVTHPRTAIKGKPFSECVVKVFEGIDFLKPKGGDTTVSYSLRFTP